jgi:hypothetical protein
MTLFCWEYGLFETKAMSSVLIASFCKDFAKRVQVNPIKLSIFLEVFYSGTSCPKVWDNLSQ